MNKNTTLKFLPNGDMLEITEEPKTYTQGVADERARIAKEIALAPGMVVKVDYAVRSFIDRDEILRRIREEPKT